MRQNFPAKLLPQPPQGHTSHSCPRYLLPWSTLPHSTPLTSLIRALDGVKGHTPYISSKLPGFVQNLSSIGITRKGWPAFLNYNSTIKFHQKASMVRGISSANTLLINVKTKRSSSLAIVVIVRKKTSLVNQIRVLSTNKLNLSCHQRQVQRIGYISHHHIVLETLNNRNNDFYHPHKPNTSQGPRVRLWFMIP